MKKKRSVTLIELLIVILLIGVIGGALAFNMKGSLDKGKVFKTEEGIRSIKDILELEMATTGKSLADVTEADAWKSIVLASPLAGRPEELVKDGWGNPYQVTIKEEQIEITSSGLDSYNAKQKK
ncbi:MAG: prepilin-type N-terminal cleavage/methylation domain-containing protein [Chlamydiota bacterium]